MKLFVHPLLVLSAATLALFSCSPFSEEPTGDESVSSPSSVEGGDAPASELEDVPALVWTPELEAEITQMAKRLEEAIANEDLDAVAASFDFRHMVGSTTAGMELPADFYTGLETGMVQAARQAALTLMGSRLKMLRILKEETRPTVLFRVQPQGGIDYLRYEMGQDEEGNWRVVDGYSYAVGAKVSTVMKSFIVAMLGELDQNLLDKFLQRSPDGAWLEGMPLISDMAEQIRQENGEAAIQIWDRLPEEMKEDRHILQLQISAASSMDGMEEPGSRYTQAIEQFAAKFPNDPSLALHSIDKYALAGDYEKSHQALMDLNEQMDDPFLEFFRGYISLLEGDLEAASKRARDWQVLSPDSPDGWELDLEVAYLQKDFPTVARALTALEGFGYEFSALEDSTEYADFMESPAGQKWWNSQLGRGIAP